jgi:hypothetical protein
MLFALNLGQKLARPGRSTVEILLANCLFQANARRKLDRRVEEAILAKSFAVLTGRNAGDLLEGSIKAAQRIETGIMRNANDPFLSGNQLPLGVCNAMPRDEHIESCAKCLPK